MSPKGTAWAQRQADFVRTLDSTRPVTSALLGDIFARAESEEGGSFFDLRPVPEDLQKDRWALATANFCTTLDVVGYNYQANRYAVDEKKFPGRVMAGTETWGHKSYEFWTETERLPHVIGDFIWIAIDYIGEAGFGAYTLDGQPSLGAPYPYHLYGCGDFNLCGVKRPQSYYREQLWGLRIAPFIAVLDPQLFGKNIAFNPWAWEPVLDTWTFPGQEGKRTRIDVYSIDEEVELFVNGISTGRKPAGKAVKNKTSFEVTYQPGMVEAIGYKGGKETGRFKLVTASEPAVLQLTPDRSVIKADTGSIAYIDIEVQDPSSRLVKHTDPEINVEVVGAGELIALGTGNPTSEESYVSSQRKAYQGHLLAIVRSNGEPGEITLTAEAEGLPAAMVKIKASVGIG